MAKKVLICDGIDQGAMIQMRSAGIEVDEKAGLQPAELEKIIGEYDAIVVRSATKVKAEHVAAGAAGRLRIIVRGGVGIDNIDVRAAEKHGVKVLNTPAASSVSVAELALGMMFALARRISQADASMKEGKWEKKAFAKGMELEGKALGIYGVGRIGRALARKASALGMRPVIAYDKFVTSADGSDGYALVTKEELLRRADIISTHIPREAGAPAEIGAAELAMMKDGVLIVNCARGGVVDEKALLAALESGKVAGAALDVFESEPPTDLALIRHPRVIATPHMGGQTHEAQSRVGAEVAMLLTERLK